MSKTLTPALLAVLNRDPGFVARREADRHPLERLAELAEGRGTPTPDEERQLARLEVERRFYEALINGEGGLPAMQMWSWDMHLAFNPPPHLAYLCEGILDRMAERLCGEWSFDGRKDNGRLAAALKRTTEEWKAGMAEELRPEEIKWHFAQYGLWRAFDEMPEPRKIRLPAPLEGSPLTWERPWSGANPDGPRGGARLTGTVKADELPHPAAVAVFVSRAKALAEEALLEEAGVLFEQDFCSIDDPDLPGEIVNRLVSRSNPLDQAMAEERCRHAFAVLSPDDREIFQMRADGFSVKEIAEKRGDKEKAIEQRIRRARTRLAPLAQLFSSPM